MTIAVSFHIEIRLFQQNKRFRMLVEHYYSSPQVERFRIHGKDRILLMEKRVRGRTWVWKITEGEVRIDNLQSAAMAIQDMQTAMDRYLKQRARDQGPDEGYVQMKKK